MKKGITFEDLGVAVATLKTLDVKWKSYAELAEALKREFGTSVDEHTLFLYYEPTVEDEEKDLRIHLNAINNV